MISFQKEPIKQQKKTKGDNPSILPPFPSHVKKKENHKK
jgi:hypothetical protein